MTKPQLGCDYRGQEFGARYPDSVCIDGYLWDADSGNATEDGWLYDNGGEMPCPQCNESYAAEQLSERLADECEDESKKPADFLDEALRRIRAYVSRMNDTWNPERATSTEPR